MVIERIWSMPNRLTFTIPPIARLLEEEVDRSLLWIDPFANRAHPWATWTNDLNPAAETTHHGEAVDFVRSFAEESVDGVLFDPPYSPRQIKECYDAIGLKVTMQTTQASFYGNVKNAMTRVVKPGGTVISFGWNTNGMGRGRGFEIVRILLVPHGAAHNDTIVTVEKRVDKRG